MTEEEIKQKFKETYPDLMRGDTPLSPYFDIWCYAIEIMEQENNELKDKIADIKANCDLAIEGRDVEIKELREKLKTSLDYNKSLLNALKNCGVSRLNSGLIERAENYIKGERK
jgi:hypothetical protein